MLLHTQCQPATSWICRLQLLIARFRAALLAGALFLLFAADAGGTTYYVDSQNGDDNYDGQAAAFLGGNTGPWASITKVNSIFFAPGDSILFKRGATWTDGPLEPRIGGAPGNTITIEERIVGQPLSFELVDLGNNNCVYFGPYNEGPKPRIDCQGEQGIILRHDYLIFESFHLDNGGNNMLWFGKETGNYWNAVIDIDVTHCTGNAVASDFGGGHLWLKSLYVYDYEKNGILMNGSLNNQMKNVLIEDCWVENPVTLDLEDGITCHSDASGNNLDGDVIIRNNTIIRSGEDGVDITSGTNILVKGNHIRNSLAAGIFVAKSWVNTVEVSGNFLHSNSIDQGVGDLTIRVPNVWAYNNVITGTGHHCLHLSNTDNTKIWHNVIAPENRTGNMIWLRDSIGQLELYNNIFDFSDSDQEISGAIPPNIIFDYNCYYNSSSTDHIYQNYSFQEYKNANPLFEPHGFFADPSFTGPGQSEPEHFQLLPASPCIDAGTPVAVPVDFWNTPRPQDGGFDLGIYEQGTVDCDPDPNSIAYPGSPCDDGDPTTTNDVYDTNCQCGGTPTACAGIGDADADGVCSDVDCDDNDPNVAYQPGDACDDGDPTTSGETIQANCSCGGGTPGPATVCSVINSSNDDAEEKSTGTMDIGSSDLELAYDPNRGHQVIGLRFNGLNIPQGATITSAHIQFTVDANINVDPSRLRIFGEHSDNPLPFADADYNISGRPRTTASVTWAPPDWLTIASFGIDQRTPDIYAIIQEIVNRPGYNSGNAIGILIDGIGGRTAESYDGFPAQAPKLCVEYTLLPPNYDCPFLSANIGHPCNDGDPSTVNDAIDADCNCIGIPTACTGIGDADGDGICSDVDCDDNDFFAVNYPGAACDDDDNTTIDDRFDNNCQCAGTPTDCTGIGDNDGDGICASVDCNDNDPNITSFTGQACDDGDNTTINDILDGNCSCAGAPTACTGIGDNDGDGVCANVDCDDNDPNITTQPGNACNDGDNTTLNDLIDANCNCVGTPTACTGIGDNDGDGVCNGVDCDDNDPNNTIQLGSACNDGDNTTINDRIDANCNCTGTPTACTGIGDNDGDGVCANVDCDDNDPNNITQPGMACNDGDNTTLNDMIDANCNCTGTPTACTGIGDNDGDGVCADADCDDNDPDNSTQPGSACNDGDNTTINDTIDANCNCTGTPTACTGIGDNDGDGVCADVDCDDNDPDNVAQPGNACDDGDNTTLDDRIDANCNCAGIPTACTGIGDNDGDGICTGVDCDDNDPNITTQPGDACDDGNPDTYGETIQSDCSCSGGVLPVNTCTRVSAGNDDAEEDDGGSVSLTSSDLELVDDSGEQIVGMRFNGLNIPQGAVISSARIQFTVDETKNLDPCNLVIRGEASDNAASFSTSDNNISSRSTTSAAVNWGPQSWSPVGAAGTGQQTPEIASIVQEIVNRNGYTSASSILILIEGTGRRVAESYNGSPAKAPELCVEYALAPAYDCPAQSANIGDACTDGDNTTFNDLIDANCNCIGTPSACTGIGDNDGDGVCADVDCDDNDPNNLSQPGNVCNDGDNTTFDDTVDANCNCVGTPTACTGIGDNDGDGICADVDCDDNDPNNQSQPGNTCNDGDNTTFNDLIDANCNCVGTPSACTSIGDNDDDGVCADVDCDDNDPTNQSQPGDACNDGDNTTFNDLIDANCNCKGTPSACTGIGDNDGDGVCVDVDCDDNDPNNTSRPGDTCDDGDNTTFGDIVDANCNCAGTPNACNGIGDNDGDGVCADTDCDDNDPNVTSQIGDACNDGDNTTFNDVLDANCNCNGTSTACTGIGDNDNDGICADVDCNDNDPAITTQPGDACNDADNTTINDMIDANCNCVGTPTACTGIGDSDADGICADVDCNDNDPAIISQPGDACNDGDNTTINDMIDANCNCAGTPTACTGIGDNDADGVCADVDCNDNNPAITTQPGDACNDGDNTTINDALDANCNCVGTPTACTGIGDNDNDGICADVDCDDNDPDNTAQPGDACNDGDPTTVDDFIQQDCTCSGNPAVPTVTCSRISAGNDDAEENDGGSVSLTSSDLELIDDSGEQIVGMRFAGLNIPQGALITSARIQFTVDETRNLDPCNLTIRGEASDDASSFSSNDHDISSRPTTGASVAWAPQSWSPIGVASADQQTPDIASIIQEIVNRSGFSDASSIVLLINGTGRRVAESYNGSPPTAPELCVEYLLVAAYDCPAFSANIGDTCDDGDNTTSNDVLDANCNCTGTSTACTGIGDNDGDGICSDLDCDDNNANVTSQPGDSCDDGDNTTSNDVLDANCNCNGTPTACTGIGDNDGDGICADVDCDDNNANVTSQPGDSCDDGDNTTSNDVLDATCNCSGTPTACTGIGDNDGDGICADVDCDDNNANVTSQPGDSCDDGDNTTSNDVLNANCNCNGTPTACTGIGDNDGDGICADVDCDDNNANVTSQPGDSCDDGDNTTSNDVLDATCNCSGTPTACTGIGDNDGDGICADVDCDDNNANVTSQPGDSCDDGDNTTSNDVLDATCNCSGTSALPTTTCSRISAGNDDAEEDDGGSVSLTSSDLELVDDSGDQTVGMRFTGLNIPQDALITSASIQFTVDETRNLDPCNLIIRGEASDDASSFSSNDNDISSRPVTGASVTWAPLSWSPIGVATPDQQTPDIASVIQEIVNRNGYTAASSIVLLIDGTGRRVAESYNGSPPNAPELCVEYLLVAAYDCPALSANTGDACDDGDNTTINDVLDANCNCVGTPTACTGIGDNDGDGICSDVDCNDSNPGITTQPGSACSDGDPTTVNDTVDADCNCVGTPTACAGIGDNDGDGICSNVDCNDNDPNTTAQAGAACDDGDNTTINDAIDANCNCVGTPTACTGIGDNDNDGICTDVDCNDNDPGITTQPGDSCDDGDPSTTGDTIQQDCSCSGVSASIACSKVSSSNDDAEENTSGTVDLSSSDLELVEDPNQGIQVVGMRFNNLAIPPGANISHAYIQFTVDETRTVDPCNLSIYGEAADNAAVFSSSNGNISSRLRTNAMVGWNPQSWSPVGNSGTAQQTPDLSPIIQEVVGRSGYTAASAIVLLVEGIGRRTAESFDGSAAQAPELCVEYTSSAQSTRPQGSMPDASTSSYLGGSPKPEPISQLSIYPNPARDRISVNFFSTVDSQVNLQVVSLRGQTLLKDSRQAYQGNNTLSLESLSLANGIYFLKLYVDGCIIPVKFAVQRD